MQWWNDVLDWFSSDEGWNIVTEAMIPALAILVAGLIAALIGRGSTKRIVSLHEREERVAAVTAMIGCARRSARWNTLSVAEQQRAEHVALECDVRIRLLPISGAALAADWAAHELAELKKTAVSFSFQAEQSLAEFRQRLVEWQAHPGRARKLFKNDLDSWAYEESLSDQDLIAQQRAWEAQQAQTQVQQAGVQEAQPQPAQARLQTQLTQAQPTQTQPAQTQPAPAAEERQHGIRLGPQNPVVTEEG